MIHARSTKVSVLVMGLSIVGAVLFAQEAEESEVSSLQWANASSVPDVKFTLLGDVVANPWRPGGQVGAGRRKTLQWSAEFSVASTGATLKDTLQLKPGQSGAAVLVGDFAEIADGSASAQARPGYSKADSDKVLRAALLRFPAGKMREPQYPIHLLNADPENRVKVEIGGAFYDLVYAVPQSLKVRAGQDVKIKVSALGLEREMSFNLEPYNRGGIIAFYRPADSEVTTFVFVNLRSLESIREMVQAEQSATSEE